jgi:hypothetical protein
LAGTDDLCQEITSQIRLVILNAESTDEAVNQFEARLYNAIFDGELQNSLIDLGSSVGVLTGQNATSAPPDEVVDKEGEVASEGLSAGAKTGIVVAVVAIAIVPLIVFLLKRGNRQHDGSKSDVYHYEPYDADGGATGGAGAPSDLEPESIDTDVYTDVAVADHTGLAAAISAKSLTKTSSSSSPSSPTGSPRGSARPLGASLSDRSFTAAASSSPDYGSKRQVDYSASSPPVYSKSIGVSTLPDYGSKSASRKALEAMEAGEDIVAEPEMDVERDSSSNAGSSGWSSSAGISSYNTGSVDDSMDAAAAAGTTLAAIGITSALTKRFESDRYAYVFILQLAPFPFAFITITDHLFLFFLEQGQGGRSFTRRITRCQP